MRLVAAFLLLAAGVALAQPRAYFPWWESRLRQDIDLTPEQQKQIREVQRKYRDQMIDQRARLEKAEARLEDLFHEEEIDDATAKALVDELVAARGAMTRSLTLMSIELRKLLTPEQWAQLDKKRSEWRAFRRRAPGLSGRRPGAHRRPARGEPGPPTPDGPPPPSLP